MTFADTATREKSWVALTSVLAAVGITTFKIIVGVATGSLGILAEAAHSGLDLLAAAMTLLAVRSASRPADQRHRFGHGKVENLSAMFEALLLIATCVWILYSAADRLFFEHIEVEVTVWSFVVMAASIVVDYSRSRALGAAAKKYHSQALEADALHFQTDIWSSATVMVGLVCVGLAHWKPSLGVLAYADAIAAILVAVIAAWVTIRLSYRTVNALLDSAPPGMEDEIRRTVEGVPGIRGCHRIRVRTSGPQVFVDIHVTLDGAETLTEAHDQTEQVERALQQIIPNVDVTVHAEPVSSVEEK